MVGKIDAEFTMGYVYFNLPKTLMLHPSQDPHFHIFYREICTAFQPDQNRIGDRTQQVV